jgi:hypothetical protein
MSALTRKWVEVWAALYPSEHAAIRDLANKEQPTVRDVEAVVRWKSSRSIGYFGRNDPTSIRVAVREALGEDDPDAALSALIPLTGVRERVASAILAAFRPDKFTVMDIRAWRSLRAQGLLKETDDLSWKQTWRPYLAECTGQTAKLGVSLRTLDRALWAADGRTDLP